MLHSQTAASIKNFIESLSDEERIVFRAMLVKRKKALED